MMAPAGIFTSHDMDGVGSFYIATDGKIHDVMHAEIRDGSQFTLSSVRYALGRLQAGDPFVDVGANLGVYAIPAAVKGCRVLAIEALPQNYSLLCQSIVKNALTSVTPVHAAAYDRATIVGMRGESAWGTITEARDGVVVPSLPLDDLLAIHGFGDAEMMKLDIEGAELVALRGLKRHLAQGRINEIIIEVNEPACHAGGYSGEVLLRALHDYGFHLYLFQDDRLVPRRFNEFRERHCCDFLATRRPVEKPPAGFTVETLPVEISVANVLEQANSAFQSGRLYVAQSLAKAPPAIRDHLAVRAAFSRLQDDPISAIREASSATQLMLTSLSPQMTGRAHLGVAEAIVPKVSAIASDTSSCGGRTAYQNREKRVAVIAPQATHCGVAYYGRNFCRNLVRTGFKAEVITFDDELMRHTSSRYKAVGNTEIAKICKKLEGYGAFCLEFEPGTLGGTHADMLARLRQFMSVRRPIAIDFHSFHRPASNTTKARLKSVLGLLRGRRSWRDEYWSIAAWWHIYETVRERERGGDLTAIVHTHEDQKYLTRVLGMSAVEHHPLAYFDEDDRATILRQVPRLRRQLELRFRLEPTDFLLGVFGFIAPHKGMHHAIEALVHLPENFKLAIFGQHHPANIPVGDTDPYLSSLVKQIEKQGLTERVLFIGDLADVDFSAAIATVDLAVFPYHEVGQRSSGPIQMAIELGMPILCSRTYCFQALSQYFPDRMRFFDIGNHLQLAQLARDIGEGRLDGIPASAPAQFTTHTLIKQFDEFLSRLKAAES